MVVISCTASTVVRFEVSIQEVEVRDCFVLRILVAELCVKTVLSSPDLIILKKENMQTQALTSRFPLTVYKLRDI
jgi:hypothetical protein